MKIAAGGALNHKNPNPPPMIAPHADTPPPGRRLIFLGNLRYAENITMLTSLAQACEALGSSNCFPFAYNATRNSVYLQDLVPSPAAEVNIRYDLLRGLQPDNGDVLDPSAGVDTGAP